MTAAPGYRPVGASKRGDGWFSQPLTVAARFGVCLIAATVSAVLWAADFRVQVADPDAWRPVLSAIGVEARVESARFRIVVGDSAAARQLGFTPSEEKVRVARSVDSRDPELAIFWETPLTLPIYGLPAGAEVFQRERSSGAPLLAGIRSEDGGVLWAATDPGPEGYERYPYVIHALRDLGLRPPFRGARTWAFFDYSYRTRVDLDYMASRWRQAGIAALHVSAWHFHDPDPRRDEYLKQLIEACHREGVLVYAWLELPHVSEAFWRDEPDCREQTAALQDAQLDWRKLVNLADPDCFERVAGGVSTLLDRFDWDGVNLAEFYFESLHGPSNPQRFTPMNEWVRRDYASRAGFDPVELFDPDSPRFWSRNARAWQSFADYRAELTLTLQRRFLALLGARRPRPHLTVTQIDDRFDPAMRELLGADTAALLRPAEEYDFQLIVEDPATLWDLGPRRYHEIARRYREIAPDPERLAIDINIVERYQRTYPTKKQVGTELLQLAHVAGEAFPRVLLYFEHSIGRADWELLPHAAAVRARVTHKVDGWIVEASRVVGVTFAGSTTVNGIPWPFTDGETVWLPAGRHELRRGGDEPALRVVHPNLDLLAVRDEANGVDFDYKAASRGLLLLDRRPGELWIDGVRVHPTIFKGVKHWTVMLPSGRHRARIEAPAALVSRVE